MTPYHILWHITRKDGAASGYLLTRFPQDPIRHHARNLYETPRKGKWQEAFPGQVAALEWDYHFVADVPDGFGRTVRDAMGKVLK